MSATGPTLSQLAALLRSCSQGDSADSSPAVLLSAIGGAADLAVAGQRDELRRWLNKWGCRLRYPQPGEPDVFSDSLAQWWASGGSGLPDDPVAELSDADVGTLADSYADLAARPAAALTRRRGAPAGHRVIAPTAASKIMFALRPKTPSLRGMGNGCACVLVPGGELDWAVEPVTARSADFALSSGPSDDRTVYRYSTSAGSPRRAALIHVRRAVQERHAGVHE
jgi:hypothetical protein